tara:strand:+ start:1096 stop:1275 length:180 start_codon:yes stop_codon:yes gene_type:complete
MNLKNAKSIKYYAIDGKNCSIQVIDENDKCFSVPLDNENTDYQNILAWVKEGNTIQEAD